MADLSLVFAALARIAAQAEGHGPCSFEVKPGGLVVCPHGVAYEVGKPVTLVPSPAAGSAGAA